MKRSAVLLNTMPAHARCSAHSDMPHKLAVIRAELGGWMDAGKLPDHEWQFISKRLFKTYMQYR